MPEHIEWDSESDPEEILFCIRKGFVVYPAAEGRQNRISKHKVDRRQYNTADYAKQNGVANAPVCIVPLIGAKRNADKRTSSVADHHGDTERDDCQRKNDRVGGVAVGAKIGGIGNKYLIDDIVKGADQKGNDAGYGIFAHELADFFCGKIGRIILFHLFYLLIYVKKV